jgi:hypothetical protein
MTRLLHIINYNQPTDDSEFSLTLRPLFIPGRFLVPIAVGGSNGHIAAGRFMSI